MKFSGNYKISGNFFSGAAGLPDESTGFDISTASFSQSYDVSGQDTFPTSIAFNTDGTKMYITGETGDSVYEYNLSTGFDISTASFFQSISILGNAGRPTGLTFNSTGTLMFITSRDFVTIARYDLSTGFDISTASFSQSYDVSGQDTFPTSIAFNTDGTKMFVAGFSADNIHEYNLSVGFDLTTATFSQTLAFSVITQYDNPQAIRFNPNGSKMFVLSNGTTAESDAVVEYALSTNYDILSASLVRSYSVFAQTSSATGLAFNITGDKMFIISAEFNNNKIFEYTLS